MILQRILQILEGKWPNFKQPNHTFASLVPPRQYKFASFLLMQFFLAGTMSRSWRYSKNLTIWSNSHLWSCCRFFPVLVLVKWCTYYPQMSLIIRWSRSMIIFYTIEWWLIMVTHVTKKSFLNPRKLCHLEILLVTIFTNVWGMCPIIF
jgi:hypothetical protein